MNRRLPGALSALLLSLAVSIAQATNLPDWVDLMMVEKASAEFPDDDMVQLMRSSDVEVKKSGWREITERAVYHIRNGDGKGYETHTFFESPDRKLKKLRGWRKDVGGRISRFDDLVTTQYLGGAFYKESRELSLVVPGVAAGALLVYEIRYSEYDEGFSVFWQPLRHRLPVYDWEVRLHLPRNWTAEGFQWNPVTEELKTLEPSSKAEREWSWVHVGIPSYGKKEPLQPSEIGLAPVFLARYAADAGGKPAGSSWKSVSDWFHEYSISALQNDAQLEQKAEELADGAAGLEEKVSRIADFVRSSISYVQIYLDDGGRRPHPAIDVYRNRFGDCKDMAHLAIALLRCCDINAYPVLTNARRGYWVWPAFPMPRFDHCIVGVESADPSRGLLYFDPTARGTCVRRLPASLEGAWALVVGAGMDSELVRLPASLSEDNAIRSHIDMTISRGLGAKARVERSLTGQACFRIRHHLAGLTEQERIEWLEDWLLECSPGMDLLESEFEGLEQVGDSMVIRFEVRLPSICKPVGDLVFIQPGLVSTHDKRLFSELDRRRPIKFRYPMRVETSVDVRYPEDWVPSEIPEIEVFENPFGSYHREYVVGEGRIQMTRLKEVRVIRMPSSDYATVREWDETCYRADRESLAFKRW